MDKTLPAPSRGGNPYLTPAAAAERTFAPAPNASSSSRAGAPQIPTPKAATTAPPLRPIPLPPRPTPSPAHHLKSHRAPRPPEARTPPVLPQYRGNGVAFGSSSWDRPPTHVSPTRILKNPAAAQPPNTATTQLRPSGGTTPSGDRDKQTTTNGLEARQNQTSGSRPITAATAPKPASVSNGNPARIPSPATRPPTTPTPKPTAPQVVRQNPKTPQQTEHTGAPPERKLRSNHPVPISDATANLHPKGTELEDGEGKQDFWIPMTEKECQQYSIKLGAVYNAFSQAVNPEVGLLAGYRVPDDGGPPVPYLVEEIAKAKDESVLQLLMTKVEEALESAKGKKTQYSSELPRGYKWFKFLFRPSYTKTGNPEEVHGKGRHLNIKNTLYRYDPYLLGHPAGKSVKFRSFNEFKPHLVWLLYANYRCKRNEPQSEEEWDARNLVNCICDYCGGYIARVVREVYWPLTRPMQYFIDAKKFDVMGPSAVFRVRERVWARVVLQEDGTISAGFSTFSTAFVKWVGRTGGYFPSQVLEGELVSIWPCEILKRTVGPDEELNAIAARMQSGAVGAQRRLAITSGAAEPVQASSNTESLSNESVIYTVRLLGVPKELHDGVLAPTTTFRSTQLFPYLLEKSAAQSKLVLPRGIQPDSAIRFREWHKAGLKEIGESAKQWRVPEKSDAGDYLRAFAFGNEVVRLGDFVRLKPAGGRLIEQAFSITRIIIDKEKKNLRLLGVRWEVQPEFAISLKDYGTRIPYWKPMNDVSGRHGDVVEKPLKEIAGRWYPVNSNATLVHNIKAGTYWYGWEALENRQVNMEVQLEGKPIDLASFDDSDVIKNNKAAALLMSSRRSRLMIQGTTEVPAPAAAADKKIPSETPSTKKRHASSTLHRCLRKQNPIQTQSSKGLSHQAQENTVLRVMKSCAEVNDSLSLRH
ncbi:hypothetical protein DFJ73DRAFT_355857 [Zopfochytrium polystomum]|nr:hypothetical protein DFJ73DRAFT_355857 [Zopfochytrium polystomum]